MAGFSEEKDQSPSNTAVVLNTILSNAQDLPYFTWRALYVVNSTYKGCIMYVNNGMVKRLKATMGRYFRPRICISLAQEIFSFFFYYLDLTQCII